MKKLWTVINEMKISKQTKNKLFLGLLILINMALGGVIWLLVGRLLLPGIEWLWCFMGYPAIFIGFFGGIYFLYFY